MCITAAIVFANALVSFKLRKYSYHDNNEFYLSFEGGRGPIRSMPNTINGQDLVMGCNLCDVLYYICANFWHYKHFLEKLSSFFKSTLKVCLPKYSISKVLPQSVTLSGCLWCRFLLHIYGRQWKWISETIQHLIRHIELL